MTIQAVTWALSGLWLLMIIYFWMKAKEYAEQLEKNEKLLRSIYFSKASDFSDPIGRLVQQGWEFSLDKQREGVIAGIRANAQSDKQKIAMYIEMMPELGLLGTVISLFFAAFVFDFNMTTLGFALVTTIMGLIGALFGKHTIELKAESHYFSIVEFLNDKTITDKLIENAESHHRKGKAPELQETPPPRKRRDSSTKNLKAFSPPQDSTPPEDSSASDEKSRQNEKENQESSKKGQASDVEESTKDTTETAQDSTDESAKEAPSETMNTSEKTAKESETSQETKQDTAS